MERQCQALANLRPAALVCGSQQTGTKTNEALEAGVRDDSPKGSCRHAIGRHGFTQDSGKAVHGERSYIVTCW